MAVRATISKGYIWRPGLIGVAALVFCAWFLYDGTVKYPLEMKQSKEYARIFQENTDPNEAGRAWEQMATENGWPTSKPTNREETDIFTQKVLAGITGPVGLYFMVTFLMSLGRWIEADENGVRTRSGKSTDYVSIKSIDKSRWKTKGIAVVHYGLGGPKERITLDDWKFDREPTKRILEAIEERMPGGDEDDIDNGQADGSSATGVADELRKLSELTQEGILTDQDFEKAKELYLGKSLSKQDEIAQELRNLYQLYREGALTESEFNMKKWDLLA